MFFKTLFAGLSWLATAINPVEHDTNTVLERNHASAQNRMQMRPQVHVSPRVTDSPVIRPMHNIYQLDPVFADLQADNGSSQICGPAAMSNALIYLKHYHTPRFPTILQNRVNDASNLNDYVRTLFALCKTDRNEGTRLFSMLDCNKAALAEGGYETDNTFVRGMHSNFSEHKLVVGPQDVVLFSQNTWQPGDSTFESDRAVTLLFGWYRTEYDYAQQKWNYIREGGHFVALAGYDSTDATKVYISNPLVNYEVVAPGAAAVSRIQLQQISNAPNINPPEGFVGLWQTADIVEGRTAVLEDMIVSVPVL